MIENVRMSFSYPNSMKKELEKKAKNHGVNGISLMGYIKLVIRKKIQKLKGEK